MTEYKLSKAGVKTFEHDTLEEIFAALEGKNKNFTIEELYIKITIGDKFIKIPAFAEVFDALERFLEEAEEEANA